MESMRRRLSTFFIALFVAAILAGPLSLRGQDKGVPELRPLYPHPITLHLHGQPPCVIYETIAKLTGISVVWAPEAEAQSETGSFTVEFSKVPLREALDKVASVTKTSWKATSGTTVSVTFPAPGDSK